MKSWQSKCIFAAIFIVIGIPLLSFLLPGVEYTVSAPRQINYNEEGSIIVKSSARGRLSLDVSVDLLGASSEKSTYKMKSDSLEIPFNVNVGAAAVLYRVTVSSTKNSYTFIGRVDVAGITKNRGIYLVTDKLKYNPGETVRFLAMRYKHHQGLVKDSGFLMTLTDSRANKMEQRSISSEDGLILDEIELSEKVNQGEWTLSIEADEMKVFTKFRVEDYVRREVDLQIECEGNSISKSNKTPVSVHARHFAGGSLDGLRVKLKSESKDGWEDEAYLKDGKAHFVLDPTRFANLLNVKLKAILYRGSETIEQFREFPLESIARQILLYSKNGFVLEGESNRLFAKIPKSYLKNTDSKKELNILYRSDENHNLKYEWKNDEISFEIPDTSGLVEIQESGKNIYSADISKWVSRGVHLNFSSFNQDSVEGNFVWSRKLYDADKLTLTLKSGDKIIDHLSQDLGQDKDVFFKFKKPKKFDKLYVEYKLQNGNKLLVSGQKKVVGKGDENGISLAFSKAETEPGGEALLSASLKTPSKAVAAFIVQDESLLQDGDKEGFALLKQQLMPDIMPTGKSGEPITFRSSNRSQLAFIDSVKSERLLRGFRALFWSAIAAVIMAFIFIQRKSFIVSVLIILGIVMLLAALLLPALGKARSKAEDAREAAKMRNFTMDSVSKSEGKEVRRDFRGNLVFQKVHFGEKGTFDIPVKFADNLTSWKAEVLAFPKDKSVKYGTSSIVSTKDLFAELSLPVFFVKGDKTSLKIVVYDKLKMGGKVSVWVPDSVAMTANTLDLPAGKERHVFQLPIEFTEHGQVTLQVKVENNESTDIQERILIIKPNGIPKEKSTALDIYSDKEKTFSVNKVPNAISQENYLSVYPGSLSESLAGVESMFREPSGCFEQTSSSNFPNIVAYDYLKERNINPVLEASVKKKLKKAYQRLASYEVDSGGFSLYGKSPASPWLTSYGILQFALMSKHIYVDEQIIKRSWKFLQPKIKSMSSHEKFFALYCAREAGLIEDKNFLVKEEELIFALHQKNLWDATVATLLLKNSKANNIEVLKSKVIDNVLKGEGFYKTVNSSGGKSAETVVTALALQSAFENKMPQTHLLKQKLISEKNNSRWYGTMATAMALRALTVSEDKGDKQLRLSINGELKVYDFTERESKALHVPLNIGDSVSLHLTKGQFLSCHLNEKTTLRYTNHHVSSNSFSASLTCASSSTLGAGLKVRLIVNAGDVQRRNLMLECPLPAGFKINQRELQQMVRDGKIRYHELKDGNRLVLYLKDLKAKSSLDLKFRIFSTAKGEFNSPAGKVYEYYKPENEQVIKLPKIIVK